MATVDLDSLPPWELTFRIGGVDHAVARPSWAELRALADLEEGVGGNDPEIEARLRETLARLVGERGRKALPLLDYRQLLAAYQALDRYFADWMGRTGVEATRQALGAPAGADATAAGPAGGRRRAGGLSVLAPYMRGGRARDV